MVLDKSGNEKYCMLFSNCLGIVVLEFHFSDSVWFSSSYSSTHFHRVNMFISNKFSLRESRPTFLEPLLQSISFTHLPYRCQAVYFLVCSSDSQDWKWERGKHNSEGSQNLPEIRIVLQITRSLIRNPSFLRKISLNL